MYEVIGCLWSNIFEKFSTFQINGCTDITLSREAFNVEEITNISAAQFVVDGQVTETSTGVTLRKRPLRKNFTARSLKMSFDGTSNKYKPGLPFLYVVREIKNSWLQLQRLSFKHTLSHSTEN